MDKLQDEEKTELRKKAVQVKPESGHSGPDGDFGFIERNAHQRKVDRDSLIAKLIINLGGLFTIITVIIMMVFIFLQVVPLFEKPEIKPLSRLDMSKGVKKNARAIIGLDEYMETAFRFTGEGKFDFFSLKDGSILNTVKIGELKGKVITSLGRAIHNNLIVYGTSDGSVGYINVKYAPVYTKTGRDVVHSVKHGGTWRLGGKADEVIYVAGTINDDEQVITAAVTKAGGLYLSTYDPDMENSAVSAIKTDGGQISAIGLTPAGDKVAAGTRAGKISVYGIDDGEAELIDNFRAADVSVTSIAFLTGDTALIVGFADGSITEWFPVRNVFVKNITDKPVHLGKAGIVLPGEERMLVDRDYQNSSVNNAISVRPAGIRYKKVRSFKSHKTQVVAISPSPRDKGFITTSKSGEVSYHYSTSGKTFYSISTGGPVESLVFAPKSNGFMLLTGNGDIRSYSLDEKHPEVTLKTLLSPVWYEGYNEPDIVWQSTGGTDDFESKFSLWPLIFGTFKGTFYAMLFSIPISVLGAVYLSQMAPAALRNVVKPLIEIMAAIPSVVVGFIAGLWLSPVIDKNLTIFFLVIFFLPAAWLILVLVFMMLPDRLRPKVKGGSELLMLSVLIFAAAYFAYHMGPLVEKALFDGDLKHWIYLTLGLLYDPRNSLVVGFALGFAVIPLIFTISEDALSSVPPSLSSAAYALSASKWQTALWVVLPAASPGIFAAVMLGLGRAVGETMIVLMATGNTPIIDMSIFNGFRAMSASIAVEMPEAPVGGSLFRVLFLTGLLLFIFTFVLNTLSVVVGQKLRKKYSRF